MTDFKLIEDFMKEARQYTQPMNELTKEAEAMISTLAPTEKAIVKIVLLKWPDLLKAQGLYTREEVQKMVEIGIKRGMLEDVSEDHMPACVGIILHAYDLPKPPKTDV